MKSFRMAVGLAAAGSALLVGDSPETEFHHINNTYECPAVINVEGEPLEVTPGSLGEVVCSVTIELRDYWDDLKPSHTADVPVVYLEDENTYTCETMGFEQNIEDRPLQNQYCNDSIEVVVTEDALDVSSATESDWQRARVWFILAHEFGHDHQKYTSLSFDLHYGWDPAAAQWAELQADCIGWKAMAAKAPELLDQMGPVASRFGFPLSHGTRDERLAVARHSIAGGDCGFDELEAKGLFPPWPEGLLREVSTFYPERKNLSSRYYIA